MRKAFLFTCLAVIFFDATAQQDTTDILLTGQQLPAFTVTRMNGEPFVSESLQGKVVLINFFATWCPPCRKELPHVQTDIFEKYKEHPDFELLIISREEKPEVVIPFIEKEQYPMAFYSDTDRSCYRLFAHQFIPRNYLFDATGRLVYQSRGFNEADFGEMLGVLEDLLR